MRSCTLLQLLPTMSASAVHLDVLPSTKQLLTSDAFVPENDSPSTVSCDVPNFSLGIEFDAKIEIDCLDYLGQGHNITLPADSSGGCSRIICTNSSAIYACNDNDYALTVNELTIGHFARKIFANASCTNGGVLGQAFSSHGWSTIVGQKDEDDCCGCE